MKINRPRHDSEPLNWNAQDCAEELLKIFEKLTQRRKIEEMEDVRSRFDELVREYIESRKEDRLMISQSGKDDIDDEFSNPVELEYE